MNNIKEMNQCFTAEWDNLLGDLALTCSMAIHFPHPSAFPAAAAGRPPVAPSTGARRNYQDPIEAPRRC